MEAEIAKLKLVDDKLLDSRHCMELALKGADMDMLDWDIKTGLHDR